MGIARTRGMVALAAALMAAALLGPWAFGRASGVTMPWVGATRLPVPSDASDGGDPVINSISCGGSGFCLAVGYYRVLINNVTYGEGLIDTLSGGTWTAQRAPLPAGVVGPASIVLDQVSCGSTAMCAIEGTYSTASVTQGQLALSWKGPGTTWKAQAIEAPAGYTFPDPSSGTIQPINGVGCTVGGCALVGNYINSARESRAWSDYLQGDTWSAPVDAPRPDDATAQTSWFHGVACGGSLCQAVGGYTSDVGWEPLVVSINPGAGTTNSPSSHVPLPMGATEIIDVLGVSCDRSGLCAAYGSYYGSGGDGASAKALVMPVGGTAFQPQAPPTPTPASTTIAPPQRLFGIGCGGGDCAVVGYYYDTAGQYHPLLDQFRAGGGVAGTAPNDTVPTSVACGGSAFCTAFSNSTYGAPLDVLTSSGWVAAPLVVPSDAIAYAATSTQESATACDSSSSCWVLGTYPAASGTSQVGAIFADHVLPTAPTPPTITSTSGMPLFSLSAATPFGWHGAAGSAPIAHYSVEVRRSTARSGFGSWATPAGWGALSPSMAGVSVPLPVGEDTCVRVQAVDTAHLASAWSAPRCTARPLDDRALSVSSGWTRVSASGYYLGTYTATKTYGASLTYASAQFDRLALVATECSTCGKVAVYSGTTLLATVNLYHSTTLKHVVIVLAQVSLRTATVRLRVVTSGKTIQIDGLGVTRT